MPKRAALCLSPTVGTNDPGSPAWNHATGHEVPGHLLSVSAVPDTGEEDLSGQGSLSAVTELKPTMAIHDRRTLLLMSLRDAGVRAPLGQEIFDELAIAIVEGRLMPGDTVNSVDLAKQFGTSRTPVREALAELERHGVIVVPPRRRPYIVKATFKQIRDVYDVRAKLFTLVSELIIDGCMRERLAILWEWQAALKDDVARGSADDYFWHNVGFRLIEVRLSGNDELQRILAALGLRTLQFRHLSLSLPGRIERSLEDHRRLLMAYEEGDKVTATTMTGTLIMSGQRAIASSGLFSGAVAFNDAAPQSETTEGPSSE